MNKNYRISWNLMELLRINRPTDPLMVTSSENKKPTSTTPFRKSLEALLSIFLSKKFKKFLRSW